MLDHERIYQLTHAEDWSALLTLIHEHPQAAAQDDLVQHALATFEEAFFGQLDAAESLSTPQADVLERFILLHSGGIYRLDDERFATLVVRLVTWHLEQGADATAAQYAPFCPDREPCTSLLNTSDTDTDPVHLEPRRAAVDHPERDRVHVTVTTPATEATHSLSLFKSAQEAAFFHAVRTVFQTYTPYPNVALSSLIDFEAIRDHLSDDERAYFFKGIVDCVLFDPHDDYRPVHFFELDSAHHDDPDQLLGRLEALGHGEHVGLRPGAVDLARKGEMQDRPAAADRPRGRGGIAGEHRTYMPNVVERAGQPEIRPPERSVLGQQRRDGPVPPGLDRPSQPCRPGGAVHGRRLQRELHLRPAVVAGLPRDHVQRLGMAQGLRGAQHRCRALARARVARRERLLQRRGPGGPGGPAPVGSGRSRPGPLAFRSDAQTGHAEGHHHRRARPGRRGVGGG